MSELITFESIMSVYRAEKGEELCRLPPGFFESVGKWLDYKKNCKDSMSQREAETAKSITDEIVNRRQRKLVMAAIRTVRGDVPPSNLG
jgi:DNA replication initiation complex subunit (GINS family)